MTDSAGLRAPQPPPPAVPLAGRLAITAHRGSSGRAPENTLASLRAAIEDGADFAELDVRLTADGTAVLMHDSSLKRTTGDHRRLRDCTLAEVRRLDAGGWFSASFAGERVPTLEEVLDLTRGRLRLNIEIKVSHGEANPADAVLAALESAGLISDCLVSSSHYETLKHLRRREPGLRLGQVVERARGFMLDRRVDFFSVRAKLVTPENVAAAHVHGRTVHAWTVNDLATAGRLAAAGTDNLMSDHPALLTTWRSGLETASISLPPV